MNTVLQCHNLQKRFTAGDGFDEVLKGITLSFERGQTSLLLGPSGSGKTTLLSILGCLLSPSSGSVVLNQRSIDFTDKAHLALTRRDRIGFVFQHAQLLPFLTVRENLAIIGDNLGISKEKTDLRIATLTEHLGITAALSKKPGELSGGQRQRVAIARAVMAKPLVVLADEPTAALDWQNAQSAVELLIEECRRENAVLIAVTHDRRLIPLFDQVLTLREGLVYEDEDQDGAYRN